MPASVADGPLSGEIALGGGDVVVCSLEPWDDVWRRNQFFVQRLLNWDPALRVLFVEPPVDVPFDLVRHRWPGAVGLRKVTADGRLWALRPRKVLPRVLAAGLADGSLARAVKRAVAKLQLDRPLLWVNDAAYAGLAEEISWPVVYDITDDWLLFEGTKRSIERLRIADSRLLVRSDEVVVVSRALVATRGRDRPVHVIGCAVDAEHFQAPRSRPADLPPSPVAVYVGTQHDVRLDVELCVATARAISPAQLVFVGPNLLEPASNRRMSGAGCRLLGTRHYDDVPAYYQHADVVVVPHRVNPFTESLDPIKGYECLAVGRPTVSTPVAGMRALGHPIEVVDPAEFPARVRQALAEDRPTQPQRPPSWSERATAFAAVLASARREHNSAHARQPRLAQ